MPIIAKTTYPHLVPTCVNNITEYGGVSSVYSTKGAGGGVRYKVGFGTMRLTLYRLAQEMQELDSK